MRREIDVIAAWSVDRLGRSLQGLVTFLGEVHGAGVELYLDLIARSNSANTPSIWNSAFPAGLLVSAPCRSDDDSKASWDLEIVRRFDVVAETMERARV